MSNKEYRLFNILLVAFSLVLVVFLYLLNGDGVPTFSCQVFQRTGTPCGSCGLTRDFVSFILLDFTSPINSQSIYVFTWWVAHILVRSLIVAFPILNTPNARKLDLVISLISAFVVFLPFWI